MKQLTCEMCGSTDLLKQDGVFVCQACGCKYSLEEAKKMMVEGTVKIDNSDKLKNLYVLARQAKESNDAENAVKYYDLIKQEDPNSWEACFYNVYFRAAQTRIMYIESAAHSINNCLDTVFNLINNNKDSLTLKQLNAADVAVHVCSLCTKLESAARSTFSDAWERTFGTYSGTGTTLSNYALEYADRTLAAANAIFTCGNLIERDFGDDSRMIGLACDCWRLGITIWKNAYVVFDNHAERYAEMKTTYVSKMQKHESDYTFTAPQYAGFPPSYVRGVRNRSDSDFRGSNPPANSSSGGCYVATAVYGSYDCPQVWTLRRFRDYTLAETWYGRTFIRTYYAISPTLVKWFGHTAWFKNMWKSKLDRMVDNLNASGVENTPYEDKIW